MFISKMPVYELENNGSDESIQYLGTKAKSQCLLVPFSFSQRKSGKSDLDGLVNIRKLLFQ